MCILYLNFVVYWLYVACLLLCRLAGCVPVSVAFCYCLGYCFRLRILLYLLCCVFVFGWNCLGLVLFALCGY